MQEVKVFVKGGLITSVLTPQGVKVIVYDYDNEDGSGVDKDEYGDMTIYEHMADVRHRN